jgi:hypothetical protein
VLRHIFRICLRHLQRCADDVAPYRRRRFVSYQYPEMDFQADFILIAKRVLGEDEYRLFRERYVRGSEWQACCRVLGMDRGKFHHACYRVEAKLGRAFLETEPFGLYPIEQYFGSEERPVTATVRETGQDRRTRELFHVMAAAAA